MDTITSKDVQDSLETNCSNRTKERDRKYETTHPEQRNSKLLCKDSLVYDLVKQTKENTFNLLNMKRKQKQKQDFEQGKIFINYRAFS